MPSLESLPVVIVSLISANCSDSHFQRTDRPEYHRRLPRQDWCRWGPTVDAKEPVGCDKVSSADAHRISTLYCIRAHDGVSICPRRAQRSVLQWRLGRVFWNDSRRMCSRAREEIRPSFSGGFGHPSVRLMCESLSKVLLLWFMMYVGLCFNIVSYHYFQHLFGLGTEINYTSWVSFVS